MFYIHKNGGLIMKPLYFAFLNDEELLIDTEQTYLLGDALMVAPPLTSNYTYNVYFPKGKWCNINKMDEIIDSKGENVEI